MNTKQLKNDFEKRFYKNKNVTEFTVSPFCITLFENVSSSEKIILPLSMSFGAIGASIDEGRVTVADSDTNTVFTFIPNSNSSSDSKLFGSKSVLKKLYQKFPHLNGCDILISSDTTILSDIPEMIIPAVIRTILRLSEIYMTAEELAKLCFEFFPDIPIWKFLQITAARKGYALYMNTSSCKIDYLPFPLNGMKTVLFRSRSVPEQDLEHTYEYTITDNETDIQQMSAALKSCETKKFAHQLTLAFKEQRYTHYPEQPLFLLNHTLSSKQILGGTVTGSTAVCFVPDSTLDYVVKDTVSAYEEKFSEHPFVYIC